MSPCDGRSRNDRRADKPRLSLIEHGRSLCSLHRATVACKETCRTAKWTKMYGYSFRADDGAHLQFMVVASNGIQTLLLFIRLRRWVASRVTETSCRGPARFSKWRGRLYGNRRRHSLRGHMARRGRLYSDKSRFGYPGARQHHRPTPAQPLGYVPYRHEPLLDFEPGTNTTTLYAVTGSNDVMKAAPAGTNGNIAIPPGGIGAVGPPARSPIQTPRPSR
jgi:hypothetical protein